MHMAVLKMCTISFYDGLIVKLFETMIESYNLLNILTNVAHKRLDWTAYILSVIIFFNE